MEVWCRIGDCLGGSCSRPVLSGSLSDLPVGPEPVLVHRQLHGKQLLHLLDPDQLLQHFLPVPLGRASSVTPVRREYLRRTGLSMLFFAVLVSPAFGIGSRHWSEDPRSEISFTRFKDGISQIETMSLEGGRPRLMLRSGPYGQSEVKWARDGDRIAFIGQLRTGEQGLYVVRIADRRFLRITLNLPAPSGAYPTSDGHPDWSPDGDRIAFQRSRLEAADLYLVRSSGGRARLLLRDGRTPAWSPDGDRIAFIRNAGNANSDVWVMDADGTNLRRLTKHPAREIHPQWSPDGTRIVFARYNDRNFEIWTMRADGRAEARLTRNRINDINPAWSPDGRSIAFASQRVSAQYDIYVMDVDGKRQRRLTSSGGDEVGPVWRPRRR